MAKLFSTPIACGLLTGVAAGGVGVLHTLYVEQWLVHPSPSRDLFVPSCAFWIIDLFLMCSGPALCARNAKLLFAAFFCAVIATLFDMSFFIPFGTLVPKLLHRLLQNHMLVIFTPTAAAGAIVGLSLAMMYRSKRWRVLAVVFGAVGNILTHIPSNIRMRIEVFIMAILIARVVAATLPVIFIDREWRTRTVSLAEAA